MLDVLAGHGVGAVLPVPESYDPGGADVQMAAPDVALKVPAGHEIDRGATDIDPGGADVQMAAPDH